MFACNVHSRQLKYGDNNYSHINKTIQIKLNNFKCNNQIKEKYLFRNNKGRVLSEKLEIIIIDMVFDKKLCYTKNELDLAKWCDVLKATSLEKLRKECESIMDGESKSKLVDETNIYSSDEEVVALYSAYTKGELERNTLLKEAEEKGITQGIHQEKIEIARNLLKQKVDIDIIINATGLTKEELEKLK